MSPAWDSDNCGDAVVQKTSPICQVILFFSLLKMIWVRNFCQ